MTREEASIIIGNLIVTPDDCYSIAEYQEAKAIAIKALEQEPCEDCVSRQSVLDLVVANHRELNGVNVVMYSPLYKDIKELPSVNPQTDVLDKIVAEIIEMRSKQNCSCSDCIDIIDKYRREQK